MEKELQGLEENLKVKIHLDSLRATLKTYQIGKSQAIMDSDKKIHFHLRQFGYRNEQMLRRNKYIRMND